MMMERWKEGERIEKRRGVKGDGDGDGAGGIHRKAPQAQMEEDL